MSEKPVDITERLQKVGEIVAQYRDAIVAHFKDMEVNVKDWNFSVGKTEKEYNIEVTVKMGVKPKTKG